MRFFRRDRTKLRPARIPSLAFFALVNVLVAMAFVLLPAFSASGEVCGCRNLPPLPSAYHGEDLIDAPMIVMGAQSVTMDGVFAGSTADAVEGNAAAFEGLRRMLKEKRELWLQVRPQEPVPDTCLLAIHRDLPASAVKTLVSAVVASGFRPSFVVQKLETPPR